MTEEVKVTKEEFQKNAEAFQKNVEQQAPVPEQQAPVPEQPIQPSQEPQKKPEPKLDINNKILRTVKIEIKPLDAEVITFESLRNLIEIKKALTENADFKIALATPGTTVKISYAFENQVENSVLVEDTAQAVLEFINGKILPIQTAMRMIQHLCVRLIETSPLKCGLITVLFDDNQVGSFGLINESLDVETGNVNAFISAATGQLDIYKTQMRKLGVDLIDDNKIILPGQK